MVDRSAGETWTGLNQYRARGPFNDFHLRSKRWAVMVAHRRAGKTVACVADLVIEAVVTKKQDARFAYIAPQYNQAKDIAWLYVKRLTADISGVQYNEAELRAKIPNGAEIRLFGADNPDRLRGIYLDGVIMDEHADMKPNVWPQIVRPMLSDRKGWAAFIGTPKGYNEFHRLWESARNNPDWFTLMLRGSESGLLDADELADMRASMADEQYQQEIECDFSAANIGAILGRYMEAAEREGRLGDVAHDPLGAPVEISSDIGFRDTAAFWFWQSKYDGYALIDYDEDTGLDAGDWIERLRGRYPYGTIWLPHDAKAKTFQSKRSVLEQFMAARIAKRVDIVPTLSKADRINAARLVIPRCRFDRTRCKAGLDGLREWSYEYNDETKTYSKEPRHDWASHPGDGFSYGAVVMRERTVKPQPKPIIPQGPVTIDQFISMGERRVRAGGRI